MQSTTESSLKWSFNPDIYFRLNEFMKEITGSQICKLIFQLMMKLSAFWPLEEKKWLNKVVLFAHNFNDVLSTFLDLNVVVVLLST